jgi:hypothetical protein
MGHKTIAMTLRDAHPSPEDQLDAVQRLNERPLTPQQTPDQDANDRPWAGLGKSRSYRRN